MKSILKECRVQSLWKQKEFAEKIGISISHLSLLENDKRTPSLELAFKIADIFCVSVEDIWAN